MWEMLGGDAVAVVTNRQSSGALLCQRHGNSDVSPRRRMSDRVVDQDHGELMEAIRVAEDLCRLRGLELEIVGGGERFRGMNRLRGDLIESDGFQADESPVGAIAASIRPGEQEQIIQEPAHAVALATNVVKRGAELVNVDHETLNARLPKQHVNVAPNGG